MKRLFRLFGSFQLTKNKNMWQLSKPIVGYYEDKQKRKEE